MMEDSSATGMKPLISTRKKQTRCAQVDALIAHNPYALPACHMPLAGCCGKVPASLALHTFLHHLDTGLALDTADHDVPSCWSVSGRAFHRRLLLRDISGMQSASPVHGRNQWPHHSPVFEAVLRQYISGCLSIGQAVMRGVLQATPVPGAGSTPKA